MTRLLGVSPMEAHTEFAPLAALGYVLTQHDFFAPLRSVELPLKTVIYSPYVKLLDCVVSILAGCSCLAQINTRLRPERALAWAWDRAAFAEQSTIADTLDAFQPETVGQLRAAMEHLYRREGQALHHDFEHERLMLDIDVTGLPASRRAQGSQKGYFAGEKTSPGGRWLG